MTGEVVWITGLPASGKSTFGRALVRRLQRARVPVVLLDGDDVHAILSEAPRFDARSRAAFYRSLSRLAAMLARQGLVVVVAATANKRLYRKEARRLAPRFCEVYVRTPLDECIARDPKGLYAHERRGGKVPGVGVPYEPPEKPEVVASGGRDRLALDRVLARLGAVSVASEDRVAI